MTPSWVLRCERIYLKEKLVRRHIISSMAKRRSQPKSQLPKSRRVLVRNPLLQEATCPTRTRHSITILRRQGQHNRWWDGNHSANFWTFKNRLRRISSKNNIDRLKHFYDLKNRRFILSSKVVTFKTWPLDIISSFWSGNILGHSRERRLGKVQSWGKCIRSAFRKNASQSWRNCKNRNPNKKGSTNRWIKFRPCWKWRKFSERSK